MPVRSSPVQSHKTGARRRARSPRSMQRSGRAVSARRSSARPWSPASSLYSDLKIPIVNKGSAPK